LIDIKASRKILITYRSEPDERNFVRNISDWLAAHRPKVAYPREQSMLLVCRPTTNEGKRVVLFRRYVFEDNENQTAPRQDITICQSTDAELKVAE
jgi:hypothetical protein